jgi:hypothetical protein
MQHITYTLGIFIFFICTAAHAAADKPYTIYTPLKDIILAATATENCLKLHMTHHDNIISQTLILQDNQMLVEDHYTQQCIPNPTLLSLMVSGNYPIALGKSSHDGVVKESTYAKHPMPFLFFGGDPALNTRLAHSMRNLSSLAAVVKKMKKDGISRPIIIVDLSRFLAQFHGADWQNILPWTAVPEYDPVTKTVKTAYLTRTHSAPDVLRFIEQHRTKPTKSKSLTFARKKRS